jgi:predicted nuclease of predicted toxin-antitoxin system
MNLLADEGVDRQIVLQLRTEGHSVWYVAEMEPSISDDLVLQRANEQHSILVTEDKDFGELVYRLGLVHHGVILVRLHGLTSEAKAHTVSDAIREHGEEIANAFSVISPGIVRIRRAAN